MKVPNHMPFWECMAFDGKPRNDVYKLWCQNKQNQHQLSAGLTLKCVRVSDCLLSSHRCFLTTAHATFFQYLSSEHKNSLYDSCHLFHELIFPNSLKFHLLQFHNLLLGTWKFHFAWSSILSLAFLLSGFSSVLRGDSQSYVSL